MTLHLHLPTQGSLRYKGPLDVVRQVARAEGGVLGLYKGLVPTLLREVPGCGAMFAAYEAIKLAAVQQQVRTACCIMFAKRCLFCLLTSHHT